MLLAYRLAGLSALVAHYAGLVTPTQSGACGAGRGQMIARMKGRRHRRLRTGKAGYAS
jgi:hypothetical protein